MQHITEIDRVAPPGDAKPQGQDAVKRPFVAPKLTFVAPKLTRQGTIENLTAAPPFVGMQSPAP